MGMNRMKCYPSYQSSNPNIPLVVHMSVCSSILRLLLLVSMSISLVTVTVGTTVCISLLPLGSGYVNWKPTEWWLIFQYRGVQIFFSLPNVMSCISSRYEIEWREGCSFCALEFLLGHIFKFRHKAINIGCACMLVMGVYIAIASSVSFHSTFF